MYLDEGANAVLTGANLTSNVATEGQGGAIFVKDAMLLLFGSILTQNSAQSGGAIYMDKSAYATVTSATFDQNTAQCGGCAITVEDYATVRVSQSKFWDCGLKNENTQACQNTSNQFLKDAPVKDIYLETCLGSAKLDIINTSDVYSSSIQLSTVSCNPRNVWRVIAIVVASVSSALLLFMALLAFGLRYKNLLLQKQLLIRALPASIANRLWRGQEVVDRHENVGVVFVDVVGYTDFSSNASSESMVNLLQSLFERLDDACEQYGCLKIKTIGDAYMAAAGTDTINIMREVALLNSTLFAYEAHKVMEAVNQIFDTSLKLRAGVYVGPVIGGESNCYSYDLFNTYMLGLQEPHTADVSKHHKRACIDDAYVRFELRKQ